MNLDFIFFLKCCRYILVFCWVAQSSHQVHLSSLWSSVHYSCTRPLRQGSQGQWFISLFVRQCVLLWSPVRRLVAAFSERSSRLPHAARRMSSAMVFIVCGWQPKLWDQPALAPVEPQIQAEFPAPRRTHRRPSLGGAAVTIWVAFPLGGSLCQWLGKWTS